MYVREVAAYQAAFAANKQALTEKRTASDDEIAAVRLRSSA